MADPGFPTGVTGWGSQQLHKMKGIWVVASNQIFPVAYPGFPRRETSLLLPPANEVCEGYVFTPVCQSFCSQGVPGPGEGVCSRRVPGPGGCLIGGCLIGGSAPGGCLVEAPSGMATAVGGTHPTGMHSCFGKFFLKTICKFSSGSSGRVRGAEKHEIYAPSPPLDPLVANNKIWTEGTNVPDVPLVP